MTWTDESIEHIAKHDVLMHEVEEVLYSRPRHREQGRDETELVFGQTDAGRYLFVVLSEAMDGGAHVVTARDMTTTERRTFRRKGR